VPVLNKGDTEYNPAGTSSVVVEIVPVAGQVTVANVAIDPLGKTVQVRSDGTKKTTVGGLDDGSQVTNKGPASVNITFQ